MTRSETDRTSLDTAGPDKCMRARADRGPRDAFSPSWSIGTGDRYGIQLERLVVGRYFDPGIGFVRRPDMRKDVATFRFSPRPRSGTRIRKLYWDGTITRITNSDGQLETRDIFGEFAIDFQNSDRFSAQLERDDEILPRPFVMAPGITIPAAGYNLETARIGYGLGPQRPFTGTLLAEYGPFYGGRRAAVSLSAGRFSPTGRLSLEPTYAMKWSSRSTDYFDGDVDLV